MRCSSHGPTVCISGCTASTLGHANRKGHGHSDVPDTRVHCCDTVAPASAPLVTNMMSVRLWTLFTHSPLAPKSVALGTSSLGRTPASAQDVGPTLPCSGGRPGQEDSRRKHPSRPRIRRAVFVILFMRSIYMHMTRDNMIQAFSWKRRGNHSVQ